MIAGAACGARTSIPFEDAHATPDAGPDGSLPDCAEQGVTYIYVVTSEEELLSFDPALSAFSPIGMLDCPAPLGYPNSMAVDRKGKAYVLFVPEGNLFEVSTATAHCKPTPFVPSQQGFTRFGMGFATDEGGRAETLYVAESHYDAAAPSKGLGVVDTATFELAFVAPFSEPLGQAVELTGNGEGHLFGFFIDTTGSANPLSHVAEIDKANGVLTNDVLLDLGAGVTSFAFAFWGGDFYLFHAEQQSATTVSRYDPTDGTLVEVASLATHVVGVGVSTCAPQ